MKIIIALLAFVFGCIENTTEVPIQPAPQDAAKPDVARIPTTCTAHIDGPTPDASSGSCDVTITVTLKCNAGEGGRLAILVADNTTFTYPVALDGAFLCDFPVQLIRNGISCSTSLTADVEWWTPGVQPVACPLN